MILPEILDQSSCRSARPLRNSAPKHICSIQPPKQTTHTNQKIKPKKRTRQARRSLWREEHQSSYPTRSAAPTMHAMRWVNRLIWDAHPHAVFICGLCHIYVYVFGMQACICWYLVLVHVCVTILLGRIRASYGRTWHCSRLFTHFSKDSKYGSNFSDLLKIPVPGLCIHRCVYVCVGGWLGMSVYVLWGLIHVSEQYFY